MIKPIRKAHDIYIYLYLIVFFITGVVTDTMLNPSDGDPVNGILTRIANYIPYVIILIGIIIYLSSNRTIKRWLVVIVGTAIIILGYIVLNRYSNLLVIWAFILFSFEIDQDKFLRYDLFVRLSVILTAVLMNVLGVTGDSSVTFVGERLVYSFGFRQKNIFGMYLMSAIIEYLILSRKKQSHNFFIGLGATLAVYWLSDSFGATITLFMFTFLSVFINKHTKEIMFGGVVLFPTLSIGSFIISVMLDVNSRLFLMINSLFTGRPYLLRIIYNEYSKNTVFGQQLPILSENDTAYFTNRHRLYADNQYMYDIMAYGWIGLTLHFFLYTTAVIKASYKKNLKILVWIIVMCIYGIVEKKILTIELIAPLMLAFAIENQDFDEKV